MEYLGNDTFSLGLEEFDSFTMTPERIRDLCLAGKISSGPGLIAEYMPTGNELNTITQMVQHAVSRGQLLNFGYWPNDMIKASAKHAGKLYVQGALAHPFSSPYIILHTWDDKTNPPPLQGDRTVASAYLVNPYPDSGDGLCIDFEAMELEGITVKGDRCLGVGDRLTLDAMESKQCDGYAVNIVPFILRFPADIIASFGIRAKDPMRAAAANVLDPVMTALGILATRGVKSETIQASDKFIKARKKLGRSVPPPYRKIDSKPYVTAIMARKEREPRESQGGTHASPKPHIRMGHFRHYKSGEKSFVHDTLVNATEEMKNKFVSSRSHYTVKGD
jgi:hypothetical protein